MSDIHSVYSLPDTEVTERKCTKFSFLHKRAKGDWASRIRLALADSVHSVGVVSELATLETMPPQAAPVTQEVNPELTPAPNVPYYPQCKYLSIQNFNSVRDPLVLIPA